MNVPVQQRLADAALVAFICGGDEWPRSLLSSTPVPDAWMALAMRRDGKRSLVPAGDVPRVERDDRLLLVRNRPLTVPLAIDECAAACDNTISGRVEILLRWSPREDDLAAAARTLLADGALKSDGLARAVESSGGRVALQRFIRERPAAGLVHDDQREALASWLREQLKRFLFESGLSLDRVASVSLTSESLARAEAAQREAAQQMQRIQAREMVQEATLAAAARRLENLSGIFAKLKAAAGGEQGRWHDLLPALSPAERGQLLANLWRVTPDARVATSIVVVAGTQCVWLDPQSPDRITQRITVDESLGGLRSVAYVCERQWLLVGAARGVWVLQADSGQTVMRLDTDAAAMPRGGFNDAALIGSRVYATHSQLGFWEWTTDGGAGTARLAPVGGVPQSVRCVAPLPDGRVVFAAADCVHAYDPATSNVAVLAATGAEITCLATLGSQVFVGQIDGKLLRFDLASPDDIWSPYRSAAPIESIAVRRWNDLVELVLAGGVQGVIGLYGDEASVARLLDGGATPLRRAWVADDLLVGLSDRRDKLIVLHAAHSGAAGREGPVARLTGHSVQDACILTRPATA